MDQPDKEEPDERLKEAIKIKRDFEGLTAHPGWRRLVARAEAQTKARREKLYLTMTSPDFTIHEQDFLKGELAGVALFMGFPEIEVTAAQALIESFKGQEDG